MTTDTPSDRERIAELEAEVARLNTVLAAVIERGAELRKARDEARAALAQAREALEMADDPVEVMAKAIHRAYQEPFPKFTHRELDDLDEATGVASRFRGMARASLAALQAEGMVIVRLPDLNNGEPTAARMVRYEQRPTSGPAGPK